MRCYSSMSGWTNIYQQFYNFSGFNLITLVRVNKSSILRDHSLNYNITHKLEEQTILEQYGGFCYGSPRTPFIGDKIKELYITGGIHRINFYTYSTYFHIDVTVHLDNTRCVGIINICRFCHSSGTGRWHVCAKCLIKFRSKLLAVLS